MSDRMRGEKHPIDPVEHAGCASFESTLALMDGLLDGGERDAAVRHAGDCALCGPMVAGWAPVGSALFDAFEDAAEAAKPDLVGMPDRVLAQVFAPAPEETAPEGGFVRLLAFARRAQAWVLLGATAGALALVIPSLMEAPADPVDGPTSVAAVAEPPPVVVVRDLAFGTDSNGMVYRTPRGGMTIIWVTENEGA